MTVRQNVAFAGKDRVNDLLARFGIAHLEGARPRRLSGGERQRVGLPGRWRAARGAPVRRAPVRPRRPHPGQRAPELFDLLHELNLPALLVTHDFVDAAALADRVGVISRGRILQMGTLPSCSPSRPTRSSPASWAAT